MNFKMRYMPLDREDVPIINEGHKMNCAVNSLCLNVNKTNFMFFFAATNKISRMKNLKLG